MDKIQRYLKNNSSTILTVLGAVGVCITAASAAKATPKAMKLLWQAQKEKDEDLTPLEQVIVAGKAYIPTVAIGVTTIGCIFGANILNKQKQAALTGAYALVNETFKDYRKTLIDLHGEEADKEVRDAMILAREYGNYHILDIDVPDHKMLIYEEITGQYRTAYEREVMDAEYHINRNFIMRGYSTLEEYLDFFGFDNVPGSDEIGWSLSDGYQWLDFNHRLVNKEGKEVCVIYPSFYPSADSLEEWI